MTWRAAVIALAAILVYANSLSAPFIFDDEVSVAANPAIRALSRAWSQPVNTPLAGRPVVGLSFALNFAAGGLDPATYRATNVAIHIACAWLLFGLVRRTLSLPSLETRFGGQAANLALAAGLVWTVHPLATDAVTYITQRTESLMAMFYLLTLYASVRSWMVIAVVACALGMGSKESMVTAPLMVVLYDRTFLFTSLRDALASRWRLYLGLAMTWWLLAFHIGARPRAGSAGFSSGVTTWTYLLNQAVMVVRYLKLAFWPSDLVITYGAPAAYGLTDVLPQAAFVVALLLMTLAAFRWNRQAAFLGAWFFITLSPASSFVPIATEVGAERRMYLPLMAVVVGLTTLAYRAVARWPRLSPRAAALAAAIVVLSFGISTIVRNREYGSWLTLAQTTLERWPTDVAYAAVGSELARLRRDDEALPLLRIGARTDIRARYNLGVTLFNLGRYEEAIRELEVLVSAAPLREEVPWAHRIMGHAFGRLSRWPEAIAQLRMVLAMTPHDAEARRLLVDTYAGYGVSLAEGQKFDAAIAEFQRGLALDPSNAGLRYNLATALFDAGRQEASQIEVRRALALDPANADAYHLLGKLLALQGDYKEGLINLETAVKLRPEDSTIRGDLERLRKFVR